MSKPKVIQTSLLSLLPANHAIGTEPVSDHLSLRLGLVKVIITRTRGDEVAQFALPVQWTPHEAAALIHEIRGVVWQLDDETGIPTHYEEIIEICEEFCKQRRL